MTRNQVIQRAEQFSKNENILEYPVNIVELCNRHGISVFEQSLPQDVSGFITVHPDNIQDYGSQSVIVVNRSDVPSRKRFTIAHELAHYILHKAENEQFYAHRDVGQSGGIEQEANTFASNILMPESLIKEALSFLSIQAYPYQRIEFIAKQFAVSLPAAEVRLSQLGLI